MYASFIRCKQACITAGYERSKPAHQHPPLPRAEARLTSTPTDTEGRESYTRCNRPGFVANYLELRQAAPELPVIPILQGWTLVDYQACLARYERAGVDLTTVPLVGLGSVCRRQHTAQIRAVIRALADAGLRLHGFGVKTKGLAAYADGLESADSLAWSLRARRSPALPGCRTHRNCANCARYALRWRATVLRELDRPRQQRLRWEARTEADEQVDRADRVPFEAEGAS